MTNLSFTYNVSPEVILNKYKDYIYQTNPTILKTITNICCNSRSFVSNVKYETGTTRVQLSMVELLSGQTLTGLTIPIFLSQSTVDIGFYSPFDGNIIQKEVLNNFLFSSSTITTPQKNPYKFTLYNTSSVEFGKFLQTTTWEVNWGDGSLNEQINNFAPAGLDHQYPTNIKSAYTITLISNSPWGTNTIKKTVYTPYEDIVANNPNGNLIFNQMGGNWNIPVSYDYIFSGDSNNNVDAQISSNFTSIPFLVSGFTKSRLSELASYGNPKYKIGDVYSVVSGSTVRNDGTRKPNTIKIGEIVSLNNPIQYKINDVTFFDFTDGTTLYLVESSGITKNMITSSAITKDETLLRIIDKPQVWSDVFVERGKNSALEYVDRLGEVDNLGDLEKYGYGFFNVKK
jgi:hypothetical protein